MTSTAHASVLTNAFARVLAAQASNQVHLAKERSLLVTTRNKHLTVITACLLKTPSSKPIASAHEKGCRFSRFPALHHTESAQDDVVGFERIRRLERRPTVEHKNVLKCHFAEMAARQWSTSIACVRQPSALAELFNHSIHTHRPVNNSYSNIPIDQKSTACNVRFESFCITVD